MFSLIFSILREYFELAQIIKAINQYYFEEKNIFPFYFVPARYDTGSLEISQSISEIERNG